MNKGRDPRHGHADLPLVSVVTPFFNTAEYLRECIESVLAQTWHNIEYVLADNCSTDDSLTIAQEYADRDDRIRIISADEHLPQLPNFNRALGQISRDSKYCKIVLADDWIYPECIEQMVGVAERSGNVGMVGSYYLEGAKLMGAGLPYDRSVFPGSEICRKQLVEGWFCLGSPTAVMYRSDLVRSRPEFYDCEALHADTEIAYEVLRNADFGFVHQVLSYMRVGNVSISSALRGLNPSSLDKLIVILKFGRRFLDDDEFADCLRTHERNYYRGYAAGLLGKNRRAFVEYHGRGHRRVGYRVSRSLLVRAVLKELTLRLFSPGRWLRGIGLRSTRHGRTSGS